MNTAHHLRRMSGRDPREEGRVATPLELLFDLTFVLAIGASSHYLAEALAEGHAVLGLIGFVFTLFAALWAWINFTWFASAFDTDDWVYRLLTMVQMAGVVVFTLGIPPAFHSLIAGHGVDTLVMVAGYVVMRVALVAQWLRAARGAPAYAVACRRYAAGILAVQIVWIVLAVTHLPGPLLFALIVVAGGIELSIPAWAERVRMTPWHPHHIAERYGLLAIIALGEGVVGTVASSTSALGGAENESWNLQAVAVLVAGVGLTFGMWWLYFSTPFGEVLHHRPSRSFVFGYGHIALFMVIAGTGAALHVAGLQLDGKAHLSTPVTALILAAPVAAYIALVYLLFGSLLGHDRLHVLLLAITAVVFAVALGLAAFGAPLAVSAILIMVTPFVSVVGFEVAGHRHIAAHLGELGKGSAAAELS